MELRHLRYFVAVAEELSFSRAAERLHMAQPPLSTQIKGLEAELGVTLFERTKRRVRLTAAGELLRTEARALLERARAVERNVKSAQAGETGHLRIGYAVSRTGQRLGEIITGFRRRHPGVTLELRDALSPHQVSALLDGSMDAGFLCVATLVPELATREIARDPLVLAVAEGSSLARLPAVGWEDLRSEPFVMLHPDLVGSYYHPFRERCRQAGFEPRAAHLVNDVQTSLWLVSLGFGVALHPATIRQVPRVGTVFRDLPADAPTAPTFLAWHRENQAPALRQLLAHVDAFLSPARPPGGAASAPGPAPLVAPALPLGPPPPPATAPRRRARRAAAA